MSDNRRNPINLLNNDCLRTTSALTGILSVVGKNPTGATCVGPIAIEPLKALRDQEVERVQARYRCDHSDVESFRSAGPCEADDPAGRSLRGEGHHGDVLQPATCKGQKCDHRREYLGPDGQPARLSLPEVHHGPEGIRIGRARVAHEGAKRGAERAASSGLSSPQQRMHFNLESTQDEEKSRGFVGL
jgi:hypothetical protein